MKSRHLAWIPVLAFSGLIFYLSSFDRNRATDWLRDELNDKILHFGAYGVWALLFALPVLLNWPRISDRSLIFWVGLAGTLYGLSDELHQVYVPGRVASIWDLLADATGATCGALAVMILRRLWRRRRGPPIPRGREDREFPSNP